MHTPPRVARLAALTVTLTVPVLLLLGNLRLAAGHAFASVEYRRASFPADPYGFSADERQDWADRVSACVLGSADPVSLAAARLPDRLVPPQRDRSQGDLAFGAREMSHLIDVRGVLQVLWWTWCGAAAACLLALAAMHADRLAAARRGAWVAVCGLALSAVVAGTSADRVMDALHAALFPGHSFLFYGSDTLIRLYPEAFWRDATVLVAGLTVIEALALTCARRPTAGAPARSCRRGDAPPGGSAPDGGGQPAPPTRGSVR